jgi:hypothetical protein
MNRRNCRNDILLPQFFHGLSISSPCPLRDHKVIAHSMRIEPEIVTALNKLKVLDIVQVQGRPDLGSFLFHFLQGRL